MEFVTGIIEIAFVIALCWTVSTWFRNRKTKSKEAIKKPLITTVVLFILGMIFANVLTPNKENTNSGNSTARVAKKSSSGKKQSSFSSSKENNESDGYSAKQLKTINKQLVKDLKEDQNFATNGNSNYDYANYVLKITLENKYAAKVMVDGSFNELSDEAKTEVGKRIIKLIQTSILSSGIELSAEDEQTGIRLSVWNGPQFEGHSKATNTYEFKWK